MGRLSRHKKIKAIDPFYEGPRKKTSDDLEGVTAPSAADDDRLPRSLRTLISAKQRAERFVSLGKKGGITKARDAISAKPHAKKETPKNENKQKALADMVKPKPGETLRDFNDRVEMASRMRLNDAVKDTKEKSVRRKEHLAGRKAKQMAQKARRKDVLSERAPSLPTAVRFGEVAQAPPTLTAQPKRKTPKVGRSPLLLDALMRPSASSTAASAGATASAASARSSGGGSGSAATGPIRPRDMAPSARIKWEAERENVIAAYRRVRGTEKPAALALMGGMA